MPPTDRKKRATKPPGPGGLDVPFDVAATGELLGYGSDGRRAYSTASTPSGIAKQMEEFDRAHLDFDHPTNLEEREAYAARLIEHAISMAERAGDSPSVLDLHGNPILKGDRVIMARQGMDSEDLEKPIYEVVQVTGQMLVVKRWQSEYDSTPFAVQASEVLRLGS